MIFETTVIIFIILSSIFQWNILNKLVSYKHRIEMLETEIEDLKEKNEN